MVKPWTFAPEFGHNAPSGRSFRTLPPAVHARTSDATKGVGQRLGRALHPPGDPRQQLVQPACAHRDVAAQRQPAARRSRPADRPKADRVWRAPARRTPQLADERDVVNVLDSGGRQAMHNHANSFASGVVYLTPTHPSSQTVFMKSPGGNDFSFKNDHKGMTPGEFCADKWVSPHPNQATWCCSPAT